MVCFSFEMQHFCYKYTYKEKTNVNRNRQNHDLMYLIDHEVVMLDR